MRRSLSGPVSGSSRESLRGPVRKSLGGSLRECRRSSLRRLLRSNPLGSRLRSRCRMRGRARRGSSLSASRAARRLPRRILTGAHDFWCEVVERVEEAPENVFWRFGSRARPCEEARECKTRTNAWPAATAGERGKGMFLGGREWNDLSFEGIFRLLTALRVENRDRGGKVEVSGVRPCESESRLATRGRD